MNEQARVDRLNERVPKFLEILGGRVAAIDSANKTATLNYDVSTDFCHSIDVVQGGFVTVMLDAAMTHAAFGLDESIVNVSSLEINTSFLEPTRAGRLRGEGKVIKDGYKTVFLEARLYDEQGLLTATASSVGKLQRRPEQ